MLESRLAYVAENELSIPSAKGGLFKKNIPAVSKNKAALSAVRSIGSWEPYVADINAYVGKGRKCSRTVRTATGNLSGTLPTADGNGSRCDGEESCAFIAETQRITRKYLEELEKDVTHFCRMYDYRSKGQDWGNSRDSIERAIWFLTTRVPKEEK